MKPRNIVILVILVIFAVALGINFSSSASMYTDFHTAKESGKKVHIVGEWVHREAAVYDMERDLFTFFLKDTLNAIEKVVYHDPKPVNFELAEKVVVIGGYEQEQFVADEILTKCASKYEETDITAAEKSTL